MKPISQPQSFSKQRLVFYSTSNHGFSFLEVMAGILLTLVFTGIAMQSLVASTYFRVRAQEEDESSSWIQENIEFIRLRADKLDFKNALYDVDLAACRATSESQGYGDRLRDDLNTVEFGGGNILDNTAVENDREFNMTSAKGNRPYIVHRRTQVKTDNNNYGADPYFNILEVSYSVLDSQRKKISSSYVEIIPEVSLRCPQ